MLTKTKQILLMMMKWSLIFSPILFAGLFLLSSYTQINPKDEPTIAKEILIASEYVTFQDNPRGLIDRRGVRYKWEIYKTPKAGKYQIKIMREKGGKSNLVYSSSVYALDRGASGYIVKFLYAKEAGYMWKEDAKSTIKAVFKSDTNFTYEVTGDMPNYADNNHGLTEAQLNAAIAPNTRFQSDIVRYVGATCNYAILKYYKLLEQ
ncbi:MAG: hypothetical protein JJT94_12080 [Bernardetiaceae bacterium]|nr:hypothetical protein [Bernardetiaceae bacterium]